MTSPLASLSSLAAVILVGGMGTRLRPVLSDRPKPLAQVHGKAFLALLLEELARQGLRRAILCTGYGASAIQEAFGDSWAGLALQYSPEPSPLGTGGALALALRLGPSDPMLVLNGDSFLPVPLERFLEAHLSSSAAATMALCQVADRADYGGVDLDEEGWVRTFLEKGTFGPGFVNGGVYLLRPTLLADVPVDRPTSLERSIFPALTDGRIQGFPVPGELLDIGTPERYARAASYFQHHEGAP